MSKNLGSSPVDPDTFLCLRNKLVVDDCTSSAEVPQLNDEIDVHIEDA